MDREELIEYARAEYGAEPEYLWKTYPNYFVLRHPGRGKWFALVMDVLKSRIGLDGTGTVDLMDLKCGPILSGANRDRRGFLPAYHMNREHWLSVLLDGSANSDEITALLEISYGLTE